MIDLISESINNIFTFFVLQCLRILAVFGPIAKQKVSFISEFVLYPKYNEFPDGFKPEYFLLNIRLIILIIVPVDSGGI